jgi:predicted site-specific integrase-resolvase
LFYYQYVKLSDYSKHIGVSYRTAWRWFKAGNLSGFQTPTGTIIVDDPRKSEARDHLVGKTVIYTRVSAAENKSNLEGQAKRIRDYYAAKGYPVSIIVKEIGSGVNDSRPKLLRILKDPSISQIVVEHKDHLTRFGFRYLK